MIELHLIGYTEDGEHLVLDLDGDGEGRYAVSVDPDLLATVEALRARRVRAGRPVDERPGPRSPAPTGEVAASPAPGPTGDPAPATEAATGPSPPKGRARPGDNGTDNGRAGRRDPAGAADPDPGPDPPREPARRPVEVAARAPVEPAPAADPAAGGPGPDSDPRLSPAEIQARLRAGRSVAAVAREAGVDRARVERWVVPILAERERVLADARRRRVDRPRARPLGVAVDRTLAERGVAPEEATWRVARRGDGRWRVTVRFAEEGRARTASWLLDPDQERLRPQSALAAELSAPRSRSGRR